MKIFIKFLMRTIGISKIVPVDVIEPPSQESVDQRLCIVCQHKSIEKVDSCFHKCDAPQNLVFDPVNGKKRRVWDYCSTHRDVNERLDLCGAAGKWFKPVDFIVVEREK